MNAEELLEKYPKAAEVVIKHYSDIFAKSVEESDATEEFKQYAREQQVANNYIVDFINGNPRGLFDVFDENEIYIQTIIHPDKTFTCSINELGSLMSFPTRKEAEKHAVEHAFEILNEKL